MSRVDDLINAGRAPVARFHELRLKYWNTDIDVICCVEGGDDIEFFLPHVSHQLSIHRNRIDFVRCAGKRTVLAMWALSKQRSWNFARLGFFVDSDLDIFLSGNQQGDQLYVTDLYSVESHVSDSDYFDSVWQDLFRLSMADARYLPWKDRYYNGLAHLARELRPLMQSAVATKSCGGGVDFERVKIDELVAVGSDGSLMRKVGRSSVSYNDVFAPPLPKLSDIRNSRRALRASDYRVWMRGKFMLWYSYVFFSRMKAALTARTAPDRAVVRFQFGPETAFSCLCSRVTPPPSLLSFLRAWAARIIENGLEPTGQAS